MVLSLSGIPLSPFAMGRCVRAPICPKGTAVFPRNEPHHHQRHLAHWGTGEKPPNMASAARPDCRLQPDPPDCTKKPASSSRPKRRVPSRPSQPFVPAGEALPPSFLPSPAPVPMVEMCEGWNSLSVKRHSKQVLPTPESPMSSRRKSTSYCLAMAGAGAASAPRGARCHPSRAFAAPVSLLSGQQAGGGSKQPAGESAARSSPGARGMPRRAR